MKNIYFIRLVYLLTFLLTSVNSIGQLSSYNWVNYTASGATVTRSVKDDADNIYSLVNIPGTFVFNGASYNFVQYIIKYNSQGAIVWVKGTRAAVYNICLTANGQNILLCGEFNSYPNGLDMGNGFSVPSSEFEGGIVFQCSGTDGATQWVKTFDPPPNPATAINIPGSEFRMTAIDATPAGIFVITNYISQNKIRKLDAVGNTVWTSQVLNNGTALTFENATFTNFADNDGNTFYSIFSDNANATTVTINNVVYPTSSVRRTYFSFDSSGKTNWCHAGVNFQPNANSVQVTRNGFVYIAGALTTSSANGITNPFIPDGCSDGYNVYKAQLKNSRYEWGAYAYNVNALNVGNDENVYLSFVGAPASIALGLTRKMYKTYPTSNTFAVVRINNLGEADSAFNAFTSTSQTRYKLFNFYRSNSGSFIYSFNQSSTGEQFSNGTLNNGGTTNSAYQYLVSLTPPAVPLPHTTRWLGTIDGSWHTALNWSNGVPTDTSTAIIPRLAVRYPTTDNEFYNFSTNNWAKCGTLVVDSGVNYYFGYGATVLGSINNNGTITYYHLLNFANLHFTGYQAFSFYGTGTLNYTGYSGSFYDYKRNGRNKISINLMSPSAIIYSACNTYNVLQMQAGNLVYSDPIYKLFINNSVIWGNGAGGTNSHINGSYSQKVVPNTTMHFQVGDGNNAQPLSLNFSGNTRISYLTASFNTTPTGTNPNPSTCVVNGQGIGSYLNAGTWSLRPDTTLEAGVTYNITTRLKGSTNTTTPNYYGLIKRTNSASPWLAAGNYVAARDSAGYTISSATDVNSFSDYAIGIAVAPLPVKLLTFTAKASGINDIITWSASHELSSLGYKLQYSTNGRTFNTIANISIQPASATPNNYNYTYYAADKGNHLYRLAQTDRDGTITYSAVALIKRNFYGESLQVYPNPVVHTIHFTQIFTPGSKIKIINKLGQVIESGTLNGNSYTPRRLSAGVYQVSITSPSNSQQTTTQITVL